MQALGFKLVLRELKARLSAPLRMQMPWVLADVIDGTLPASVFAQLARVHQAIDHGDTDLARAYAEFRHTQLNPLAAVYRWGLDPDVLLARTLRHDDPSLPPLLASPSWFASGLRQSEGGAPLTHKAQALSEAAAFYQQQRTATYAVLTLLERAGIPHAPELAHTLNCSLRTLERHLQAEGSSVAVLRSAVRLVRANAQLRTQAHLSTIAFEQRFADQAHMTRCFIRSCGLTPRTLQLLYWGKTQIPPAANGTQRHRTQARAATAQPAI